MSEIWEVVLTAVGLTVVIAGGLSLMIAIVNDLPEFRYPPSK